MLGQRMRDNRLARFLAGGCHAKHRPFLPLIFGTSARPHTNTAADGPYISLFRTYFVQKRQDVELREYQIE